MDCTNPVLWLLVPFLVIGAVFVGALVWFGMRLLNDLTKP